MRLPSEFSLNRNEKTGMLKRLIKISIIIIGIILTIPTLWFLDMWKETDSALSKVESSLIIERPLLPAEVTIEAVLFNPSNHNSMRPEDYLALDYLDGSRSDKVIDFAIKRKILAYRLRRKHKRDSLYLTWLSQEYFGKGHYGVDAISEVLFKVKVHDLTEDQAIAIAVLSRQPTLYHNDHERWRLSQKSAKEKTSFTIK